MAKARKRRRRLQVTSLIDVIFLLLLFFMLTSTFSKFAEVDLVAAGSGARAAETVKPVFLQLGQDSLRLNSEVLFLDAIGTSALADVPEMTPVLVALGADVDAQRLTDLLVALRAFPNLIVSVLGG